MSTHDRILLRVDRRELATILAALRFHQDENLQGGKAIADEAIAGIATDAGTLTPLDCAQVNRICQKLNLDFEVAGLNIQPPHRESGEEPLYRVVYSIDVNAPNPRQAARLTRQVLADPDSLPPILQVIDWRGAVTTIDLVAGAGGHG